jgi:thiol-disulfide isomerase/thioredoxin
MRRFLIPLLLAAPLLGAVAIKPEAARKRAPDFELKDRSGKAVKLSDYEGRVVLIDFWATWCAPCKSAMPWLNDLAAQNREKGFEVLGVSMDEDGWPKVLPFLDKVKVGYPILMGNKRVAYLYGEVESLPLAFFVDRKGRVAAMHLGAASRKDFEKTVRELLAN